MKLYLVQHADAVTKESDPDRPLSAQGVADAQRMAEFIKPLGIQVREIWHSTLTRSAETAAILAGAVGSAGGQIRRQGLCPGDRVKPVAKTLREMDCALMIVGHQPFLGALASKLLVGKRRREIVAFQKGGIACLERDGEGVWRLLWCIIPELLRGSDGDVAAQPGPPPEASAP